jgi:organic hydroperoxide reductase OsmC/OhrA
MTAPFPHHYETSLRWREERQGLVSASPRPAILGGPPPQFDGQESWWSPEHLLLASASLCLMTTYLALAAKAELKTLAYDCVAEGTLDRTPEGFRFTAILLKVSLKVPPADAERAARLIESGKKHCIVSNSLAVPVKLQAAVNDGVTA